MRLEGLAERNHTIADLLVLLAVVCLAIVTWSHLTDAVPLWRTYTSVGLTVLLALAALTRRPHWAAAIRLLMGGWLIAAPYVLSFADIAPALWAYFATGATLATLSVPVFRRQDRLLPRFGTAAELEA